MTADPRAALAAFTAALERHLEASASRHGENDPTVVAAYQDVADAFDAYDDALLDAYGEVTPLEIYGADEDDDLDDDEDDEDDDADESDSDDDDELEEPDDEDGDTDRVYLGLDDSEYDADDDEDSDDRSDDESDEFDGDGPASGVQTAPSSPGAHV